MPLTELKGTGIYWREDGDPDGAPIVFANALGTDHRLWDGVLSYLPAGLRVIRYDKRGHGLSDCPPRPYSMGALVSDAERLLDHLQLRDCLFVGISIGGMIAQGLAVKRLDLVRAVVLSNTAAKIGTHGTWDDRIATVESGGIEALADGTMERWFSKPFRATPDMRTWRHMLTRTPVEGYLGCMAAIRGTDFYTPTSGLTLPTMVIAGTEDGSTPPDLVRETAELIKGARFELMSGAGHLPCVEQPKAYAALLADFARSIGHI